MTTKRHKIAFRLRSFYNDEMRISRAKIIFIFLSTVLFFNACSETDSANNNSANGNANRANTSVKTNSNAEIVPQEYVEELAKIIKLNVLPEETVYIETNLNTKNDAPNVPAPNEKKLVAVMKFSPENAAQIVAQAEKHKATELSDIDAENWFPAELVAQSQLTGDEFLKGVTYAPNDFLQMPYSKGKLTRINNTDYFILELTTF